MSAATALTVADERPVRLPATKAVVPRTAWRSGIRPGGDRAVPEETAIALTYNGATQAVMMATPDDLEDFAVGFSLTERLVTSPDDIESIEIIPLDDGIEARLWVSESCGARLAERRRTMAGPTGCGLCGVESLAEVLPVPRQVGSTARFSVWELMTAMAALGESQPLHQATRAVHAAGFWSPEAGLGIVREDLGRHNAMDKLVGAMARHRLPAAGGITVITSRVSVEIVQKAAVLGAPVLMAVSAPTALAIRTAEAAGITLVAVARDDGFEIFTRGDRISQ
ncbi:formate dehydrogenase accessory sulfurtransferase FdhD [Lutibaculum baratangense]|nr:formate dehydrogenase accessory sulfurtransferase FdhD [Lutibaculum baratangense]